MLCFSEKSTLKLLNVEPKLKVLEDVFMSGASDFSGSFLADMLLSIFVSPEGVPSV